jgi:hypothetical protein
MAMPPGSQMLMQSDGSIVAAPVPLEQTQHPPPFVDHSQLVFPTQPPPTAGPPPTLQPPYTAAPPYLQAQPPPVASTVPASVYYTPSGPLILQSSQAPPLFPAPNPPPGVLDINAHPHVPVTVPAPAPAPAPAPISRDPREPPPPPPSPPKSKPQRLPPNWKIAKDAEGKTYFYHSVTRLPIFCYLA